MTKEQRSAWRKANPEKHAEEQRLHYARNAEKERARTLKYKKKHPEKQAKHLATRLQKLKRERPNNRSKEAASRAIRRTRKTQAGGSFTQQEWFTLCFAVGFKCLCCKEIKTLEPDHVIPVVFGGSSFLHNIQPLCRSCNSKKNTKCIDYRNQV